jgi:signal transduction histidine kinase
MELRAPSVGSPMPSYEQELTASQLGALRAACLLAAPLLLAFSLLDRALAPGEWFGLLGLRAIAALLLLGCARAAQRHLASPLLLAAAGTALITGTIEAALIRTGGALSPYLYSMMVVQAGVSILLPLRTWQAVLLNAEILLLALGPLLLRPLPQEQLMALAVASSYLGTMAVVSVVGATVQERVRRREHQARAEFARHFGLLNLGTLAGGLAHELSNPLNALFLQVEMLSKDPEISPKRLEKLRSNLERMRNILEAMRNGARLSGGERRPVDLAREADLAFTLMEARLRNKVSLVRAYAQIPSVYCQPTLLGQVLVNLLSNAADAVAGRDHPRVALRVRREGPMAFIEVEDNGPGVPEELREKIFQPFFSTKGDLGNGLGLWISSEIARVHGGTLSVHKGSWGGALFRVELPIDARTLEALQPQGEAAQA